LSEDAMEDIKALQEQGAKKDEDAGWGWLDTIEMVPVVGSIVGALREGRKGNWLMMALNGIFLALDIVGFFTFGATAALSFLGKGTAKSGIKIAANVTGLFMVGGGVPKNFAQDTVVCAEVLGHEVPMHKYAVQITVADVRDGACSSSTLKEASSWGKVDTAFEQMVYAEATTVVPLIASYAYHTGRYNATVCRQFTNTRFNIKR